jgi:hypothetical protein
VCACGNWVCTAAACHGTEAKLNPQDRVYSVHEGHLPSKEERQELLRGFKASEHVNLDQIENEVPAKFVVEPRADDSSIEDGGKDSTTS